MSPSTRMRLIDVFFLYFVDNSDALGAAEDDAIT